MTKLKVGLQLYSVREYLKQDLLGTLKKVKAMGYDVVETAGLYGHTGAEFKKALDEAGLTALSAHVDRWEILSDVQGVIKTYAELGCKYIAIPWTDKNTDLPGTDGYEQFKKDLKTIAAECKKYGIPLLYHNHDFEFDKVDGEYKLDILYKDNPADVLQTEIDTCWARVGGEDPAAFVLKYSGRAPVVHMKDYAGKKTNNMYKLINKTEEQPAEESGEPFQFRPVGYGVQDVKSIIEAAEKAGAELIIVEQDEPALGKTALECAQMSIEYIKSL